MMSLLICHSCAPKPVGLKALPGLQPLLPWPFCAYLLFPSCVTDFPAILQHANPGLTSGPWHRLLPLLGRPFPQTSPWLPLSPASSPCSNITSLWDLCTSYNRVMEVMISFLIVHCLFPHPQLKASFTRARVLSLSFIDTTQAPRRMPALSRCSWILNGNKSQCAKSVKFQALICKSQFNSHSGPLVTALRWTDGLNYSWYQELGNKFYNSHFSMGYFI